ncbi:MAG TPA: serine hydrolase domain-containing protein [Chloroflexota bacterium]|nr:serine hydrolase domain-containing protein [Chloroflexota bacterium]
MSQILTERIRALLVEETDAARMKGVVVAAALPGEEAEYLALGTDASGRELTTDTLFSVASITKLATSLAVLRLVDRGRISVDDPLSRHLPEADAAQEGVTVRRLLSHSAGMPIDPPSELAPYEPGLDWSVLARACKHTPPERAPYGAVQYSNVGYGLLALIVEKETGLDFPEALRDLVLRPLGIEGYLGEEPPRLPAQLTGVRGRHVGTPLEPFNSPFWRSLGMPWAGLVTTVAGALTLVRAFQGVPAGFLRAETVAEATRNQNDDLSGGYVQPLFWKRCPWGLGPEIRGEKSPHWAPPEAGPTSFGHAGASGCLAWADPATGLSWAIMGSRTSDSGWLLRRGTVMSRAFLEAARG